MHCASPNRSKRAINAAQRPAIVDHVIRAQHLREVFEAQVALEKGQAADAGKTAYQAMLRAAKGLVKVNFPNVTDDPEHIVSEFRARFYDTQLFWDPFAGGKFANYLFDAHKRASQPHTLESSRYLIDEAQLFIDAAHSCNSKLGAAAAVGA